MADDSATHAPTAYASSVSIEWKRLTFTITKKGKCGKKDETIKILQGVDGFLPGGRLLAVMGPSGSGKTSFINMIADRVPKVAGAKASGEVLIDGVPRRSIPAFSRLASYVLQDDSLYPMLTVYETLLLAARFRLPVSVSLKDKKARVEGLIDELGIRQARDTVIGDDKHKGVSGGERKRTNVGVEIIGDPSLVFLDEPTSGLDAFQALNVVQLLTRLSRDRGRTIVVSIHQPRSSIYALFDRLLLFAGGRVMYNGDAVAAVDHFSKKLNLDCPVHFNPADFFIDMISINEALDDKGEGDRKRIDAIAKAAEEVRVSSSSELEKGKPKEDGDARSFAAHAGVIKMQGGCACTGRYHSSLFEQFGLLYIRSLRSKVRDKPALIFPVFAALFFAIIVGILYSGMTLGQKSIQDRTGVLFFVCINQAFGGVFGVANTFPNEKKIVDRERTGGAYAVLPYYIAKWLAELPFAIMGPIAFAVVAYFMVGLVREFDNFVVFVAIIVMINMVAVSFGMLISSASNSVEQAAAFGPLVVIVFLLFGGFYVNTDNIPTAIAWIQEFSFFKWGFKALCRNEYQDLVFVNAEGTPCTEMLALNVSSGPLACAFVDGNQVLTLLTFETGSVGQCVLYLAIMAATVHLIAYACLVSKRQAFAPLDEPVVEGE